MFILTAKDFENISQKNSRNVREEFLGLHDMIEKELQSVGLVPHTNKKALLNKLDFPYVSLRYWTARYAMILDGQSGWYDWSNIELMADGRGLFAGIWFGKNDKSPERLKRHESDIIAAADNYPGYSWQNESGESADGKLIKWLCEKSHETVFRKQILSADNNRIEEKQIAKELCGLSDYLNILLEK